MANLYLIDDEPSVRSALRFLLESKGHRVVESGRVDDALDSMSHTHPDLVILDVCMPGMSGLDGLKEIRTRFGEIPTVVITGQGSMEIAIEAMKRGAFDYQLKPFEPDQLLKTIQRALSLKRSLESESFVNHQPEHNDEIIGQSDAIQRVFKLIGKVAPSDSTVLIHGESGTGKELVARAIHRFSLRSDRPLLTVNCAALPMSLVESELFGHERGAFTGATQTHIGRFEQAHGGTIFLDEVGELPFESQSRFLRILQQRTLERIGGKHAISVDVRIVAATNLDLQRAVQNGTFREDLFHRLNVVDIELPPLRERGQDARYLMTYFLRRFSTQLDRQPPTLSETAMDYLRDYSWPGNVRELEHFVQRLVLLHGGDIVDIEELQSLMPLPKRVASNVMGSDFMEQVIQRFFDHYSGNTIFEDVVAEIEKRLLRHGMLASGENQSAAARLLGLSRSTLQAKLKRHGLS
jgi:DNA-binding NtrC family response regulator